MVHIKIYGSEPAVTENMKELISAELIRRKIGWKCSVYSAEEELLNLEDHEKKEAELIFLDIDILQDTGFRIGKKLKYEKRNRNVVFVSSHESFIFKAQECFPLYFLRKSRISEEMGGIIEHVWERYKDKQIRFFYSAGADRHCVLAEQIRYITYCSHKITITLADGQKQVFRGSVRECEEQLRNADFFKANSGTLVNLKHCEKFNGDGFLMEDGEKILVSRERRKQAREQFAAYWSQ